MFAVEAKTADEAWRKVAGELRSTGSGVRTQQSRVGETREVLQASILITDPRERWVVSRLPPINVAFALIEVLWILSGRNDSSLPVAFNKALPKYAGLGATFHGAYGHRLRKHFGVDQFERAFESLRANPESRQVVLQLWDARADLPTRDGIPAAADIPCNVLSMLKVRDGALYWTQILRSNDVHLGLPYNLVQFTMLQEILAGWLGLKVGHYMHVADSLHAYSHDLLVMREDTAAVPEPNSDSLRFSRDEFASSFRELARRTDEVATEEVTATGVLSATKWSDGPGPLRNILLVLGAERLRRMSHPAATDLIDECSNPAYRQLWTRWAARRQHT
jgi:thymidylate synthase